MSVRKTLFALLVCCVLASAAIAQSTVYVDAKRTVVVDRTRGVDTRVDYPGLASLGPWDDRNYALTAEDLALLAPNEAELRDPIPVFFRVALRRENPGLPRVGPAQYPRSAFNAFRLTHGGYLVDGVVYTGVTWSGSRWAIENDTALTEGPLAEGTDSLSGEIRVTSPNGAAESAIKIHPSNANKVIAGTNGPGGGQVMHVSSDGGSTWSVAGALPQGGTCCDPTVDWSSNGQYAYAATLGNCVFACNVWFYRSNDGGLTWNGLESTTPGDPRREIAGGADKEFLHVDKHPTSPFKDNLYLTWHESNVMKVARSTDFGNTWSVQSFSSLSGDLGIGSDIVTGPNGTVYYFWPAFNSRTIRLRRSTDGGASWGTITTVAATQDGYDFAIPSMESRRAFIYVGADADLTTGPYAGSIYAAWTDTTAPESGIPANNHARIQVAYSRDNGNTWTVTTPHETADQLTVDRFHPWLGVGNDGTVYVAYYDTRRDPSRTSVDFFFSKSVDGAQTWSAPERLTAVLSPNISDGFEWGDYNGLDVVASQLLTIFTDNRDESGGSSQSVDVYSAGRQVGGAAICGDGVIQAGEACDTGQLGGKTCATFGCTGGGTLACKGDCSGFDTTACTGCPTCNNNGICELGEDCGNCSADCASGSTPGASCGNGTCEAGNGEDCLSCPSDCAGNQGGKPANRFCCGDGDGSSPVSCSDSRCTSGGRACTSQPVVPGSFCCGDTVCEAGESCANCGLDCRTNTVEICGNGVDDDCANGAECSDPTCASTPACQPTCAPLGSSCSTNGQCCSNRCRGGTCK
jgi:hypothetical protein